MNYGRNAIDDTLRVDEPVDGFLRFRLPSVEKVPSRSQTQVRSSQAGRRGAGRRGVGGGMTQMR